jgi:hypothetical protein
MIGDYEWARDAITGKSVLLAAMPSGMEIAYDVPCPYKAPPEEFPKMYPFDPQGKPLTPALAREMLAVYLG